MSTRNIELGAAGEELAIDFLKNKGYRIIKRNYKNKLGEVDIIAKDKETFCFVEVRTRTSREMGSPLESITKNKKHQITKAALCYLKENKLWEAPCRFDVVSIMHDGSGSDIELIQDAFELESRYRY
jgi:putative endonuclease